MSEYPKAIDAPENNAEVIDWIIKHLKEHKYLLAFADDGVIWGRMDGDKLVTSHQFDGSLSPELRGKTLQQAFLFDEKEEVRLFRDETNSDIENKWQACQIATEDKDKNMIRESHILWGDESVGELQYGFLQVKDNTKGIPNQFIPAERNVSKDKKECPRLEVHHLVDYNKDGEAYIKVSRLAGLSIGYRNEEV